MTVEVRDMLRNQGVLERYESLAAKLLGTEYVVFVKLVDANKIYVLAPNKPNTFIRFDDLGNRAINGVHATLTSDNITLSFIGQGHWETKIQVFERNSEIYNCYATVYQQLQQSLHV